MDSLETRIPPVVIGLVAAVLTWVGSLFGERLLDSELFGIIGLLFAIVGMTLGTLGVSIFLAAKTTVNPHSIDEASSLVTTGVYRFTRNPMYLGLLAFLVSWALWQGTLIGLIVGTTFFVLALTRLQILPEERMLMAKFGSEYEDYCSNVRRWL
jgi:protein-S-isoprenylcysteine O-methyltransferase Ste14